MFRNCSKRVWIAIGSILLAPGGVAAGQPLRVEGPKVDRSEATGAAPERPRIAQPGEYRIGVGDVIAVDIWKEPDASSTGAPVRPDGKISLVLLGEIQAAGNSPMELQGLLASKYSEFIHDARVTVIVKEINSQRAFVVGEVRKPGEIRLQTPITVLQALAAVGGFTDYAKRKNISVLRPQSGGKSMLPFDYDAVVRGLKMEQNILLLPGDTVIVPR